ISDQIRSGIDWGEFSSSYRFTPQVDQRRRRAAVSANGEPGIVRRKVSVDALNSECTLPNRLVESRDPPKAQRLRQVVIACLLPGARQIIVSYHPLRIRTDFDRRPHDMLRNLDWFLGARAQFQRPDEDLALPFFRFV